MHADSVPRKQCEFSNLSGNALCHSLRELRSDSEYRSAYLRVLMANCFGFIRCLYHRCVYKFRRSPRPQQHPRSNIYERAMPPISYYPRTGNVVPSQHRVSVDAVQHLPHQVLRPAWFTPSLWHWLDFGVTTNAIDRPTVSRRRVRRDRNDPRVPAKL